MIELRWLQRSEPVPGHPDCGQYVKVLQYRVLKPPQGHKSRGSWSDWQDVPVVNPPEA